MGFSRRKLLQLFGAASASIVVSSGIQGCVKTSNNSSSPNDTPPPEGLFIHGVASGDPLQDRVIIWTRVSPANSETLTVSWEVATDETFSNLINQDSASVTMDTNHTLKVDVIGLDPETTYYYRFSCEGEYSDTGTTKTLPTTTDSVRLAAFSCANFPAGFFHVYQAAADRSDHLDAILHLGDYIYEYDKDGYADAGTGEEINRVHDPVTECISLDDYRTRYAQYRSDVSLQNLHAKLPFICVWDDHEVANDTYKDGAENHQEDEGSFEDRRAAAIQAWYEWLPVRAPVIEANKIKTYRSFEFGNLVSLLMLDTRIIGRDKQLDYIEYYNEDGTLDLLSLENDTQDESRTMLGQEQLSWLESQLQDSVARATNWQVLGQQVLMGKMYLPGSILQPDPETGLPDPKNMLTYQLVIVAFKTFADAIADTLGFNELQALIEQIEGYESLSDAQQAIELTNQLEEEDPETYQQIKSTLPADVIIVLDSFGYLVDETVNPKIPYNLDAWDGYAAEREIIYNKVKELDANLIVLAGDTHNAWANHLTNDNEEIVGVEFATASVSSPGLEEYLSIPEGLEAPIESLITETVDDLQYTNWSQRGYIELSFTADSVTGDWYFIPRDAQKSSQKPSLSKLKTFTTSNASNGFK